MIDHSPPTPPTELRRMPELLHLQSELTLATKGGSTKLSLTRTVGLGISPYIHPMCGPSMVYSGRLSSRLTIS